MNSEASHFEGPGLSHPVGLPPDAPSPLSLLLENQDILGEIFLHIGVNLTTEINDRAEARKDLYRAAQTCRAFLDPALNSLWRVLPSLFPLLKLLGGSLKLMGSKYVIHEVNSWDWVKFDAHARRVRVLLLEENGRSISPFTYLRLSRLKDGPLIPSLKELHIPPDLSMDLTMPFIILSSQIQVLELNKNTVDNDEFFGSFFASVVTDSPHLRKLTLRGNSQIDVQPVLRLKSLRNLELYLPLVYFSSLFLQELGNLESLVELTLHVGTSALPPAGAPSGPARGGKKGKGGKKIGSFPAVGRSPSPFSTPLYPSLRKVRIIGSPMSMPRIMRYLSFKFLDSFTIEENGERSDMGTGPFWMDCLETLASSAHTIKTITINQQGPDPWGNHTNAPLSAPLITPLLNLYSLEVLEINNSSFSWCNSDFLDMVSALPNLKRLLLPGSCADSSPTLMALWNPSTISPKLEELRICIFNNETSQSIPNDLPSIRIRHQDSHHFLRKLYISSSFGQLSDLDVIQVGRLFNCAFPNLQIIAGFGPYEDRESWARVDAFRGALQEIKRQESLQVIHDLSVGIVL